MAEVIHERVVDRPVESASSGNGIGLIVGVLLVIAVLYMLFIYGLPLMRSAATPSTNIQVPDKINVDVNAPKGQ